MTFRLMAMEDYPACYNLWRNTPGMGLNSLDDSAEGIARYLQRNPNTCFVAEEEGQLLGAILAGHDGRRGHISHTAVAAHAQRRGIGAQLVEHAMAALEREGITKVNLVVFARTDLGNAFWEKRGFFRRDDIVIRDKLIHEMVRMDT